MTKIESINEMLKDAKQKSISETKAILIELGKTEIDLYENDCYVQVALNSWSGDLEGYMVSSVKLDGDNLLFNTLEVGEYIPATDLNSFDAYCLLLGVDEYRTTINENEENDEE